MVTSYNLGKALRAGRPVPDPNPKILIPESDARDILQERYDYIAGVLEDEFETTYYSFLTCSVLRYEVMNLISVCKPVMADFNFPKRDETRMLRYAVIAIIADYLTEGGDHGV